jgi:endonuclease G
MRKIFPILIALSFQFAYPQKILLPEISPNDIIVKHSAYTLNYNEEHEQAEWVAYILTKNRVYGTVKRTNNFRSDPKVKTGSATLADYKGSGYDRGHLAPAADMKWSATTMSESFYVSNMSPQRPGFNRGIWKRLEQLVRTWAVEYEEIHVVTGTVLKDDFRRIGPNQVSVPEYFVNVIKAIIMDEPGLYYNVTEIPEWDLNLSTIPWSPLFFNKFYSIKG